MLSILLALLTSLLMYSTRNTSTANATMRAQTVAAGTAAGAFVLDIPRSVDSSADVQHSSKLHTFKCQCRDQVLKEQHLLT
jgi:hypothetical protein